MNAPQKEEPLEVRIEIGPQDLFNICTVCSFSRYLGGFLSAFLTCLAISFYGWGCGIGVLIATSVVAHVIYFWSQKGSINEFYHDKVLFALKQQGLTIEKNKVVKLMDDDNV
jgi:hypothetical protein